MSAEPNITPEEELPGDEASVFEEKKSCPMTKVLIGVSLGLLVGTAIAIALRPPARRAAIGRSLRDSSDKLADLLETAACEGRKSLERGYALAAEAASDAKAKAGCALGKLKDKKSCCFWS